MTTIIIDDDPYFLKLLSRQLISIGLEDLVFHTDPTAGLSQIRANPTDTALVVCDLQMPGVDGIQIVRKLAEIGYAGALMLVSGEDARILRAAQELGMALKLNVVAALQKPVTIAQLRSAVERLQDATNAAARKPRLNYEAADIRQAIDDNRLLLHVQPLVSLTDRHLVGAEALLRWQHPTDGLVFPDQFLAAAEAGGLMEDLTATVLRQALNICAGWSQAGLSTGISVNISMENLVATGLPDLVEAELARTGVAATQLTLEVTESRMMQNRVAALDVLTRLRLKRVGLSIDDFGTGHSSLAQLRDLPFTELKIDRSFVHGASHDATRASICAASLLLARELGLNVVAEGIEDEEDWNYIRSAGAAIGQGYFIARPMPPEQLPLWLSDWNKKPAW